MNILTFSSLYPNAARPGHGIFVETRLRQLLGSGRVKSTVVAPVPWFPLRSARFGSYAAHARAPQEEIRHGIRVLHPRYPVVPKIGMALAPWLLAAAVRPVVERLLRRDAFDLIDAHYLYPDGVAAVMIGRRLGKPVVMTARGTDVNVIPRYRLPRRMIQWAARHASGIITVSHALKESLVALGVSPGGIEVLRNGVDLQFFRPVERGVERARLGFVRATLLSVGNLVPLKGHDIVIQALRLLPGHDLVIAGEGPERPRLAALVRECGVENRVTFTGMLAQDDLRRYYGAADALVLASSREGWPNVLLEAMACGTPVVASDVGGCAEVVSEAAAGALLAERTPQAVAHGVQGVLAAPDRSATRRYAERFDWTPTTDGQLRMFEGIVAGAESAGRRREARRSAALSGGHEA